MPSDVGDLPQPAMPAYTTVAWGEMTYSNYLSLEAFANLLIRKEILTKDEIIEEITLIKHKHHSRPE